MNLKGIQEMLNRALGSYVFTLTREQLEKAAQLNLLGESLKHLVKRPHTLSPLTYRTIFVYVGPTMTFIKQNTVYRTDLRFPDEATDYAIELLGMLRNREISVTEFKSMLLTVFTPNREP